MFPTPYADLNQVLTRLIQNIHAVLGDDFIGAYLQGSFALGDFDLNSDVDFVVAIERELADDQVQALQEMHGRIFDLGLPWPQHLEGSYFPKEILRDCSRRDALVWYLDNGHRSLIRSTHCNTSIVRWVVREHGVVLAGPNPGELIDPVPVDILRREMLEGSADWGEQILADPEQINNRFYQTFAVLHYCRVIHDLSTGIPSSKRASTEWAKTNLDPVWADLIDRAWLGRPNPEQSVRTPADPDDLALTLRFIRYVLDLGNKFQDDYGIIRPNQ